MRKVNQEVDEKGSGGVWDQSIDYVVEFLRLRGFTPIDKLEFIRGSEND